MFRYLILGRSLRLCGLGEIRRVYFASCRRGSSNAPHGGGESPQQSSSTLETRIMRQPRYSVIRDLSIYCTTNNIER